MTSPSQTAHAKIALDRLAVGSVGVEVHGVGTSGQDGHHDCREAQRDNDKHKNEAIGFRCLH